MYAAIKNNIHQFLMAMRPGLTMKYADIYSPRSTYWVSEEKTIAAFCEEESIKAKFSFHHAATIEQKS